MPFYSYDGEKPQSAQPEAQNDHSEAPESTSGPDLPNPEAQSNKVEEYPQPNEADRVEITPSQPVYYQQGSQQGPQAPYTNQQFTPEEQRTYASVQRLTMFSLIAAAVSYFIGGVPLSLLALIGAIIAYRKIRANYETASPAMKNEYAQSMRLARVALVLAAGGVILNGIQTYMLFNVLQEAGYGSMFPWESAGQAPSGGSAVWG